jgi:hypothetical protein
VELAQRHGVEVHLYRGLLGCDAGVVAEAGAQDEQGRGFVHEPARDGRAASAQDTTSQGMVVRHLPFRLERRDHRRRERLGQRQDLVHMEPGTVADDDHGTLRAAQEIHGPVQRLRRWGDGAGREPSCRLTCARSVRRRRLLHFVGEDEVGDTPVQDCALARQVHELGVLAGGEDRLAPLGHLAEGSGQVDFLEGAGSEHLRVHLPGEGQHRRAIHVGVPETGQQVRGTRAGNGKAGRWSAGELPVG